MTEPTLLVATVAVAAGMRGSAWECAVESQLIHLSLNPIPVVNAQMLTLRSESHDSICQCSDSKLGQ